jgi:hypothetical protein
MRALRSFLHDHRRIVAVLAAMALAMKALVAVGYMISPASRSLTVQICADASGRSYSKQLTVPFDQNGNERANQHGKADGVCPYSGVSMTSLAGADAPLLILALAFIVARALAPTRWPPLAKIHHDRPPLRGPPFPT